MFRTRNAALGSSKTAQNMTDDAEFGIDPFVVTHVLTGNYAGAARQLLTSGSNLLNDNTSTVRVSPTSYCRMARM
ncbi:hypothetical protein [Bradyrhizobium sp. USDA 3315]